MTAPTKSRTVSAPSTTRGGAPGGCGGYLNSLIWGEDYSWSDAGKDFAWGAGTTLALGGLGKAGGAVFRNTKAATWLQKNATPHLPAKLRGQYKCPPTEQPSTKSSLSKAVKAHHEKVRKDERGSISLPGGGNVRLPGVGDKPTKVVNTKMEHAVERAADDNRAGFDGDEGAARRALQQLGRSIMAHGFPKGTIPDTNPNSVLVPFGRGGYAVYRIMKNGNAVLRTVLEAR